MSLPGIVVLAPGLPLPGQTPLERVLAWAIVTADRARQLVGSASLTDDERALVEKIHAASAELRQSIMTRLDPGGIGGSK